ncbi:hypothetical protein [Escherichia coli]|uniref:hypothetical protein n=1 Tax=Escherichia coli TaxID=562 RepID=UPI00207BFA63|nr:hypothetical protein [Escherichia coli]
MATKSNIYKDPRWLSLVEKYKDNWVLAAKELFDIDLSHQQQQIVEAIQPNNAKATVTTPHGIGRPQVLAVWICPYISRHLLSLNPLLACCRRYSRGER